MVKDSVDVVKDERLAEFVVKSHRDTHPDAQALSLPIPPCLSLPLPMSPYFSLSLPASPYLSLSLPASPYISPYLRDAQEDAAAETNAPAEQATAYP